jgi:hypothetical protein
MSLQHLSTESVTEKELLRLVSDGVAESKTLEYKEALVLVTDEQKREFLSDVTALGNTDGGDLLLGMKADKGVAIDLIGLKGFVPDDSIAKIENLLRDAVQPRLMGVQIRPIPLQNGNTALLVRVPRSFASPHMVRHQGVTRFCGRNSNGKYDLDIHELRSAFLANETQSERLKSYRLDRVNRLAGGDAPAAMLGNSYIVLHVLPVIGLRAETKLSTQDFQRVRNSQDLQPIYSRGWGGSFTFEGLLVKSSAGEGRFHSYVQVTRNGFLEAVESQIISPRPNRINSSELHKFIPSILWERELIEALPRYFRALNTLSLPPPYAVSLTLTNIKGYHMGVDANYDNFEARAVTQTHLITDELLIESPAEQPAKILRPLFDQIWNACGWSQSINYKPDGSWGLAR